MASWKTHVLLMPARPEKGLPVRLCRVSITNERVAVRVWYDPGMRWRPVFITVKGAENETLHDEAQRHWQVRLDLGGHHVPMDDPEAIAAAKAEVMLANIGQTSTRRQTIRRGRRGRRIRR